MIDEASGAALYATRGEYETARQTASRLFTDLRSTVDTPDRLDGAEREAATACASLQRPDVTVTVTA